MLDIKDKKLLDSLIGSRVVEFQFSKTNENEIQLDAVIIERVSYNQNWVPIYTQYCVFADNCDDLGIVRYE